MSLATRFRSAVTGRFVGRSHATDHPATTVGERSPRGTATALQVIVEGYVEHQSWRCAYPSDWGAGDCPCGLAGLLQGAGLGIMDEASPPDPPNPGAVGTQS